MFVLLPRSHAPAPPKYSALVLCGQPCALVWSVAISVVLSGLSGCGAGSAAGSMSGPPISPEPAGPATVKISSPVSGDSVDAPVRFSFALSNAPRNYDHMDLQADGRTVFNTRAQRTDAASVFLEPGPHSIAVIAYDSNQTRIDESTIALNIGTNVVTLANLQNLNGWKWCTAVLDEETCAGGLGDAISSIEQGVDTPSLSGNSARFTIGGNTGYSNALWWRSLGSGTPVSHFKYDVYFYLREPDKPEALEFDVNQSYNGTRYTWGTECSYKNTGRWDVWDPETLTWQTTAVPCPIVSADTWHHLVWQFERSNEQVHYVSVTLDGETTPVDLYYNPQSSWTRGDDINVAFQMDGDWRQDPYEVWLDELTLTASY
jgi:hypothetical protein